MGGKGGTVVCPVTNKCKIIKPSNLWFQRAGTKGTAGRQTGRNLKQKPFARVTLRIGGAAGAYSWDEGGKYQRQFEGAVPALQWPDEKTGGSEEAADGSESGSDVFDGDLFGDSDDECEWDADYGGQSEAGSFEEATFADATTDAASVATEDDE